MVPLCVICSCGQCSLEGFPLAMGYSCPTQDRKRLTLYCWLRNPCPLDSPLLVMLPLEAQYKGDQPSSVCPDQGGDRTCVAGSSLGAVGLPDCRGQAHQDPGKPAEAHEKKESLGTSPANYLRDPEDLRTTGQEDQVGDPGINSVVELRTVSVCFGGIPADSVADRLITDRTLGWDPVKEGGLRSLYPSCQHTHPLAIKPHCLAQKDSLTVAILPY